MTINFLGHKVQSPIFFGVKVSIIVNPPHFRTANVAFIPSIFLRFPKMLLTHQLLGRLILLHLLSVCVSLCTWLSICIRFSGLLLFWMLAKVLAACIFHSKRRNLWCCRITVEVVGTHWVFLHGYEVSMTLCLQSILLIYIFIYIADIFIWYIYIDLLYCW